MVKFFYLHPVYSVHCAAGGCVMKMKMISGPLQICFGRFYNNMIVVGHFTRCVATAFEMIRDFHLAPTA